MIDRGIRCERTLCVRKVKEASKREEKRRRNARSHAHTHTCARLRSASLNFQFNGGLRSVER